MSKSVSPPIGPGRVPVPVQAGPPARHDSVRYRRALIIMASASGTGVPAIARLVATHPDTARDVIHAFNAQGLAMLAPRWGPWPAETDHR
jgi:hypothetical protein